MIDLQASRVRLGCALLAGITAFASSIARAESRGFVIVDFHTATYSDPSHCPRGGNGASVDIHRRALKRLGYGRAEVERILVDMHDASGTSKRELLTRRGKDGKAVDPFNDPASAVDPGIELASGRYAHGFNLDGDPTTGYVEPETGEKGVDNQLFRVVGCFQQYDVRLPVSPFYEDVMWDTAFDTMPAWVFTISGKDLTADGPVTVTFDRALQHPRRNAAGGALANATYTVEAGSRSHAKFQGVIRRGELTVDTGTLRLEGEPPILTELNLRQMRLRLNFEPDGRLTGFIGGYQPWMDFFYMAASAGEENIGLDIPGIYHAFTRAADAYPDPESGANTAISATYRIGAVPAFLADVRGRLLAGIGRPAVHFAGAD